MSITLLIFDILLKRQISVFSENVIHFLYKQLIQVFI